GQAQGQFSLECGQGLGSGGANGANRGGTHEGGSKLPVPGFNPYWECHHAPPPDHVLYALCDLSSMVTRAVRRIGPRILIWDAGDSDARAVVRNGMGGILGESRRVMLLRGV